MGDEKIIKNKLVMYDTLGNRLVIEDMPKTKRTTKEVLAWLDGKREERSRFREMVVNIFNKADACGTCKVEHGDPEKVTEEIKEHCNGSLKRKLLEEINKED